MLAHILLGIQNFRGSASVLLLGMAAEQPALVLQAGPQSGHHHHPLSRLRLSLVEKSPSRALNIKMRTDDDKKS